MMATQARPNYESSSSKAYDALIDQLENLPSPSHEPEIQVNEPAPVPTEFNSDAQPAPPTIAAPIQDNTASETTSQSHGNAFPQGLILPAQEPQVHSPPPNYNHFNGYAQPREEPKPTYVPPPTQSQPSYQLPPQTRLPPSVNEKYNGYPSLDHSESSNTSYPSLETSSAEDKIKNILQMYPTNPQPQQKPQPIMPQVQQVAPQPVISQPQFAQPQQSSPQVQPARPMYTQMQQPQPQVQQVYQPSPVVQQKPAVQQQPQIQPAMPSPLVARPQQVTPQPVAQPAPAPQQVQQLAQAQIQSQQINQQTVQVQVQQQQQIQVLQAQQLQQQNMIQQQIQYSKEMCIQMQSYFERIARFMENVDKRLNNLEKVTNDMLKNTSHASGNANPVSGYPVSSTPSEVPIESMFDRSELERLKKLQSQFDDDAAVARRLQEEYEREAAKSSSSSKASSSKSTSTSIPTPKSTSDKYDTCPICQVQILSSKLAQHVNECLDGPDVYDGKTPTPTPTPGEEKKGFWSSLFGGKKEDAKTDTPTPTPSQPVYDLSQNPPQNSKGTYYPAPVMPQMPATGTPGYPPNGYPMVYPYQFPGGQPMYYYMPTGAPQQQPKK